MQVAQSLSGVSHDQCTGVRGTNAKTIYKTLSYTDLLAPPVRRLGSICNKKFLMTWYERTQTTCSLFPFATSTLLPGQLANRTCNKNN